MTLSLSEELEPEESLDELEVESLDELLPESPAGVDDVDDGVSLEDAGPGINNMPNAQIQAAASPVQ